jgi:D-tyrosyl-tRNA(Tyr) deacylase
VRAVIQRVSNASVEVDGEIVSSIGRGFLVLVGTIRDDTEADARYIATKIAGMRIFTDENGKMNLDLHQVNGSVLLVSQFTLAGDARKGKRPDFFLSGDPNEAIVLLDLITEQLKRADIPVQTGVFAAHMKVSLVNDGPVTILLDSRKEF